MKFPQEVLPMPCDKLFLKTKALFTDVLLSRPTFKGNFSIMFIYYSITGHGIVLTEMILKFPEVLTLLSTHFVFKYYSIWKIIK